MGQMKLLAAVSVLAVLLAPIASAKESQHAQKCETVSQVKAVLQKKFGKEADEFTLLPPKVADVISNAVSTPDGTTQLYGMAASEAKTFIVVAFDSKGCELGMAPISFDQLVRMFTPAPDPSKSVGTTDKLGRDHI